MTWREYPPCHCTFLQCVVIQVRMFACIIAIWRIGVVAEQKYMLEEEVVTDIFLY